MKYAHIISKLTSTPWLATPEVMESITRLLNSRVSGEPMEAHAASDKPADRGLYEVKDGTAVIQVSGVIGKRLSMMETACGGVDVDAIRYAFDSAMADAGVSSVLLHIDSPGGSSIGTPELAAHIASTKSKPVVAYTDTQACSGGYYLAASADAIYSSETAQIGSIGAISRVVDQSGAMERAGLKVHTFKSGEFKDLGSSLRPMSDSEKALFQSSIDTLGARFRADVKANRPLIPASAMEAQVFDGTEAFANKLTDGIYNTVNEVLALMRGAN